MRVPTATESEEGTVATDGVDDLVRDRHYCTMHGLPAWYLLGTRVRGIGVRQLTPPETRPFYLTFPIPISIFWSSLLYLFDVSQKPHTIWEQVGAGLQIPSGVWLFLSLVFFPLAVMLLVTTIPCIGVFIVLS